MIEKKVGMSYSLGNLPATIADRCELRSVVIERTVDKLRLLGNN